MRFALILPAGLSLMTSSAFAEGTHCPLHARLAAQKTAPASPVKLTATPPAIQTIIPSSTPPLPRPSPRHFSPESVVLAECGVDTPVAKVVENQAQEAMPVASMAMTPAQDYENLLAASLKPGADDLRVFDYEGVKARGGKVVIDAFISEQSARNPETMSAAEATAFWANLYNAVTLQVVLENYPVVSIREIKSGARKGPWKRDLVTVNGRVMSLDDIEHGTLRKQFPSPYIHYMVNCASIGCPNLSPQLWRAETLEADQQAAASAYINSARGVSLSGDKLTVSSIYKWFKGDFGGKPGVLEHIRAHADADLAAAVDSGAKISKYGYNWSLNE